MTGSYDEQPLIVFWEMTKACALACVHCRARAQRRPAPGELTTGEGLALIEEIARWGDPPPRLVLTGGDPLERADLLELVRAAHARGVSVALAPAASRLLTHDAIKDLALAGAWGIALSLDGASPGTHDAFRRFPGAFARVAEAIDWAQEAGLATQINTVAHRGNVDELPRIFTLVRELGVDAWEVIPLIPTGRAARLPALTPLEMESILHFLEDASGYGVRVHAAEAPASRRVALTRRRGGRGPLDDPLYARLRHGLVVRFGEPRESSGPLGTTRSGAGVVFVAADGAVMPSGFLPVSGGNVREVPLARVYREAPLFRALREPRRFERPCGTCEFRDACGGSRARAFAATGDPLGADPSCPRVTAGA
ncbi:MAG: TIGR04053 family radical SAM/SPASM domain-containing protein [Thermoplasmatota archaeon]